MTTRGLPGFLRRTRRNDFEESEDDADVDTDVDTDANYMNENYKEMHNRDHQDKKKQNHKDLEASASASNKQQSKAAVARFTDGIDNEEVDTQLENKGESTISAQPKNTNATDTQQRTSKINKASTMVASDNFDSYHSLSSIKDRRVSYRESQFSKILNAPVVKLPELRKLGWNGIPVRSPSHLIFMALWRPGWSGVEWDTVLQ